MDEWTRAELIEDVDEKIYEMVCLGDGRSKTVKLCAEEIVDFIAERLQK